MSRFLILALAMLVAASSVHALSCNSANYERCVQTKLFKSVTTISSYMTNADEFAVGNSQTGMRRTLVHTLPAYHRPDCVSFFLATEEGHTSPGKHVVSAHNVATKWSHDQVTWTQTGKGEEQWNSPGGDFDTTPISTVTLGPTITEMPLHTQANPLMALEISVMLKLDVEAADGGLVNFDHEKSYHTVCEGARTNVVVAAREVEATDFSLSPQDDTNHSHDKLEDWEIALIVVSSVLGLLILICIILIIVLCLRGDSDGGNSKFNTNTNRQENIESM
eukprot:TRINITY_DN778_c1_g1_i1.p1 TRINITY_DN778_c1_g1~~TRINITY_DN778_c1_g1_i1.p1  ORF type:complete len:278 (+),score=70.35 TRINITY_DN778_c1_g1_i1:149-982(+)